MKYLKTIGLLLFVIGFALFNVSLFWSDYQLTPEIVKSQISEEKKASALLLETKEIVAPEPSSNFKFIADLSAAFERVNERQLAIFSFSDTELDKLASYNKEKFTIASVDSVFTGNDEQSTFKRKAFKDNGSWLDGQATSREQIQTVADNIKKYSIISQFGFDRYAVKDLKYSITKAAAISPVKSNPTLYLFLTFGLCIIGSMLYILPKLKLPTGIKNNGIFFNVMKNVQWLGILTGSWLIAFYVFLYFYPEYMTNWVLMVDPVSHFLSGNQAGRFFLYGFIYTLCILVMGVRMLINYRHSKYQILRTCSVMFFQTAFAFLIPEIMIRLNQPYFDFKNIWPLDYSFFFNNRLDTLLANGGLGVFMLVWGIALIVIAVPVLVYFFGKRWYCSWVCGCGGLAETLGDPYRQLSNKKLSAWKIERWMIHGVLVFAVVMTGGVLYTYFTNSSWVLFFDSYKLREVYGAFIGAGFAGVVGTGFYPLMGNRTWCRFGCPLAAYLGIIQRFKSRFRITTNGGQCISCGNCSTYCEMGIDVRWYAQRGQNIVRSSCVGCGVCSSVCPRGVLNLEVKEEEGRFGKAILIGGNGIKLAD
ncbi:MAG: 4Fe-4S binding protein [Cytophagales bacterium]|jgi:ferredoxin-type protein NapH|nr:4Fe-4S binding protein [Cytophagales bacterium]MCA6389309.1 4Fe-4S binding protein [Cytophagales bacterium]MCA6392764.1 4Fe-4S binding protein [Cytophagales bacterium]MCA6394737.1 4Fe-4S binding protein [Cytophagales bacterium]MCA6398080.1 4Fe-4S binding protein [Cytophagales bacterium]